MDKPREGFSARRLDFSAVLVENSAVLADFCRPHVAKICVSPCASHRRALNSFSNGQKTFICFENCVSTTNFAQLQRNIGTLRAVFCIRHRGFMTLSAQLHDNKARLL